MAAASTLGLTLRDIYQARARLAGTIRHTPLSPSPQLTGLAGNPVLLKLENEQVTGSFKLRGALNAVRALSEEERSRGVVTVSTGNHGRAIAYACQLSGARAVVCLSRLVPANKVSAIEELGAEVRIGGESQDEAQREAERLVAEEGMTLVPPFDHREVIAGQGTLALEIVEARPDVERVLVPLSGGGLIAGVALALKATDPGIRVVGVSMERGCAMYQSVKAGSPLEVEEVEGLADSLGGGIGLDNRYTFEMVRELVDDLVLVSEERIAEAIAHAYREERQVVEGAGAAGIAALLSGAVPGAPARGGATVVVVSGGNIDMESHARLVTSARPGRTAGPSAAGGDRREIVKGGGG